MRPVAVKGDEYKLERYRADEISRKAADLARNLNSTHLSHRNIK